MRRGKNNNGPSPTNGVKIATGAKNDSAGVLSIKQTTQLSKKLSYLLRHGAVKDGFNVDNAGFILVNDILAHQHYESHNLEQIKFVVDNNDKKRFELQPVDVEDESQGYKIRAV